MKKKGNGKQESASVKNTARQLDLRKLYQSFLIDQRCNGNSPKTLRYYEQNITRFLKYLEENFGSTDLLPSLLDQVKQYTLYLKSSHKIDPVSGLKKDEYLSSSTIRTYVRAVKCFVSWLGNEGFIDEFLARKIKLPKATKKAIEILDEQEIDMIMNYLKQKKTNHYRDLAIFCCSLELGARLSEITFLKIKDVHLEQGICKVLGKGNKERYITFGRSLQKILSKYIYQERPEPFNDKVESLFLKSDGKPITTTTIVQLFRRIKNATGIEKLHPHLMRHTMITMSLAKDSNIFALKQKTGHSSFEIMGNYLHMAEGLGNMKANGISVLDSLSFK